MSKYGKTYHLPFSPGLQNGDRVSETIEHLIGRKIVITEKLDGSNTCYTKDDVFGRSHAAPTKNPWDAKARELHSIIKHSISEDLYLFGEGMEAIHSIEYKNIYSPFYLFGARYNNIWSSWEEVEEFAYLLNIPTVPVLFKGVVQSERELKVLVEHLAKMESELDGIREGVVVRVADEFDNEYFSTYVQKWVRSNHVQTVDKHWQKNWRKSDIKYY